MQSWYTSIQKNPPNQRRAAAMQCFLGWAQREKTARPPRETETVSLAVTSCRRWNGQFPIESGPSTRIVFFFTQIQWIIIEFPLAKLKAIIPKIPIELGAAYNDQQVSGGYTVSAMERAIKFLWPQSDMKVSWRGRNSPETTGIGLLLSEILNMLSHDCSESRQPISNDQFLRCTPGCGRARQWDTALCQLSFRLDFFINQDRSAGCFQNGAGKSHQLIGGKHPMILLGFNHPFGGAGIRNHPQYLSLISSNWESHIPVFT